MGLFTYKRLEAVVTWTYSDECPRSFDARLILDLWAKVQNNIPLTKLEVAVVEDTISGFHIDVQKYL